LQKRYVAEVNVRITCRNDPIAAVIEKETGAQVSGSNQFGSSGWSSQIVYTTVDGQTFFVKTSRKSADSMFSGEAKALQAMYGTYFQLDHPS
jgi:fructosamine-3-kinase